MCSYTSARVRFRDCRQDEPHVFEKRYYQRCDTAKATGAYCTDATFDSNLGVFGDTTRRGPCKRCRDSAISVDTVVEAASLD
ncbi:hypothetical protein BDV26DRAFT_299087 [Aspergillus bertholletiae]|uniref:Uncharacterized protein n=1 Tax=Aspergillus bertholletiae TaxID=1226010 RepID=A0A5N7AMM2_9EURO|nr:hypothetical protein BDV26DRAFT_299087 [Aspergillus bertholletiae]